MPIALELDQGRVPVKVWTADLEPQARRQLENVAALPIVHGHIAAMPDVHAGIGATIGSVIPTKGAIIPAATGVDIGCGINAVQLSITAKDLPESLRAIRGAIESAVPVGFDMHASGGVQSRETRHSLRRTAAYSSPAFALPPVASRIARVRAARAGSPRVRGTSPSSSQRAPEMRRRTTNAGPVLSAMTSR